MQVKGKSNQNLQTSDESPKDAQNDSSDEENQIPESSFTADANEEINFQPPVQSQKPEEREVTEEKGNIPNGILSEPHNEGEEGWQPVQRPRSAGSYKQRLRQRRATIGKFYSYQKKEVVNEPNDHARIKSTYLQNSKYYLKNSYHATKFPSSSNRFGRRIVKAVTYRIKSVPSSTKTTADLESGHNSGSNEVQQISQKNSIVSLGKSPSYKEVALAPPGTIAKLQNYVIDNREVGVGNQGDKSSDIKEESQKDDSLDSIDDLKDGKGVEVSEKKQEALVDDPTMIVCATGEGVEMGCRKEVHELVQEKTIEIDGIPSSVDLPRIEQIEKDIEESIQTIAIPNPIDSPKVEKDLQETIQTTVFPNSKDSPKEEHLEEDIKENIQVDVIPNTIEFQKEEQHDKNVIPESLDFLKEDLKDKSSVVNSGDIREVSNKKLSASAPPFNPRASPIPMNVTLPSVSSWPMNMTLHPGSATVMSTVNPMCSSPHHPYPSPPPTPNMIHHPMPMPFIYPPPYTQPQPIPSTNYHPTHFAWQCGINPNPAEFIAAPTWPSCRPMDFTIVPPVIDPVSDPIIQAKVQSDNIESLTADIKNTAEAKSEANIMDPECIEKSEKENRAVSEITGSSNEKHSLRENKDESERTFNILIRGRRNRKQTLRMPISLLNRPYGSQSFKVIYNRVIRGSESPKSMTFSPSSEESPASTT